MSETTFWMGGDAIERPEPRRAGIGRWLLIAVAAFVALALIAGGSA